MLSARLPFLRCTPDVNGVSAQTLLMRQLSTIETSLIPIILVALLVLSSLTMAQHVNTKIFAITSLAMVGGVGVITLLNKESILMKIFEVARLAIVTTLLALTLQGIISPSVTAPLLVASTGFSFCCLSNSLLPIFKRQQVNEDIDDAQVDEDIDDAEDTIRSLAAFKIEHEQRIWTLIPKDEAYDYATFDYLPVTLENSVTKESLVVYYKARKL